MILVEIATPSGDKVGVGRLSQKWVVVTFYSIIR